MVRQRCGGAKPPEHCRCCRQPRQPRQRRLPVALALFTLLAAGCATADPEPGIREDAPDWVVGQPPSSARAEYFVGRGSDRDSSPVRAEEQAVASLVAEITRYLGVDVESTSTAVAAASLDDFQGRVTQTVEQRGHARIQGLRVEDRYVEYRNGEITVHVLARYERNALERERERLNELFAERIEAVEGPSRLAEQRLREGRRFEAAKLFLEAAAAASASELRGSELQVRNNLLAARTALSPIRVTVPAGQSHTVEISYETGSGREPASGVDVFITHPASGPQGRTAFSTTRATSDGAGRVRFSPADGAPAGTIHVGIDLSAHLDALSDRRDDSDLNAIREFLRGARIQLQHERQPYGAAARSWAVVVIERDRGGNPVSEVRSASTLRSALVDAGHQVSGSFLRAREISGMSDRRIVDAVLEEHPAVDYVLIGRASLTEFSDRNGMLARVDGEFSVVDARSGLIIAAWSGFTRSTGGTSEGTIAAGFRRIGTRAAEELLSRLR